MPKIAREHLSDQPSYQALTFNIESQPPRKAIATVIIPASFVSTIYKEASLAQRDAAHPHGFAQQEVPLDYIISTYQANLIEHLKEFIFKFFVIGFLYHEIRHKKIALADEPRLITIELEPDKDARYQFELNLFYEINIIQWKYLPFKAPVRKRYKDLDRQVDNFLREEQTLASQRDKTVVETGDWVLFALSIADKNNEILLDDYKEQFWLKVGHEEVDSTLREILLGKKIGEKFFSTNSALQDFFSDQVDTNYNFCIEIVDIQPYTYFCFEQFKRHFRIKTNKEMHQKLVEVYSYRNDISQRREMAEGALNVMISKHPFSVPQALVDQQQDLLLNAMYRNPDFNVYRTQENFKQNVKTLAENQVKETVFIDQLAYNENTNITNQDVKQYLNFTKRPRMKEFVYFLPPTTRIGGQEMPIGAQEMKRTCLREKALNHIIYHLTKK